MASTLTTANPSIRGRSAFQTLRPTVKAAGSKSRHILAAWIVLAGAFLPSDIQLNVGGVKLTVGRIAILLLLVPAIATFLAKGRHRVAADATAVATGIWMVAIVLISDGSNSLASAGAQSLEFVGAYLIARAYFFSTPSLLGLISTLKAVTVIVVIVGFFDNATGRLLVQDTAASIFGTVSPQVGYRYGLARAASTFDHAILYGTFCSLLAGIFLYSQKRLLSRIGWVGMCVIGCISSLSSVAILSVSIIFATFAYDKVMSTVRPRWKLFLLLILGMIAFLFLFSQNPIGWLVTHLTLDPETGYFRIMIWDAATFIISSDPWTGVGFREYGSWILDATVDCVWLEQSMRYGLPMTALLLLTNILAITPAKSTRKDPVDGPTIARLRTAFTIVLSMYMFIGLTVHFWNYLWMFWGLCIGVRASLKERETYAAA